MHMSKADRMEAIAWRLAHDAAYLRLDDRRRMQCADDSLELYDLAQRVREEEPSKKISNLPNWRRLFHKENTGP